MIHTPSDSVLLSHPSSDSPLSPSQHQQGQPQAAQSLGGFTPHNLLQPQTPMMSPAVHQLQGTTPSHGGQSSHYNPSTPAPMTPLNPASNDPGIVPQLQ